jgi:hypothetical protein
MLGPILAFLFTSSIPSFFSEGTILLLHYISAFGFIFYVPIGFFIVFLGFWRRTG